MTKMGTDTNKPGSIADHDKQSLMFAISIRPNPCYAFDSADRSGLKEGSAMLERAAILQTIDDVYAARARGDATALEAFWAPAVEFRLVGDAGLLPEVPVGPVDMRRAVGKLIALFTFHKHERLDTIVDNGVAGVHWRILVSADGENPVSTEMFDVWKFDADGKITSLLQFTDTGMIQQLLGRAASARQAVHAEGEVT